MSEKEVNDLWNKLKNATDSTSLLKKHLTPNVFKALKQSKTKLGGTLADCIRSGCLNTDSGVGIYASDPEAYTVFAQVFDKIIKDYHKITEIKHPKPDFGKAKILKDNELNLDPEGKHVLSTRVRVGRSHEGFAFPPVLKKEDRLKMEQMSVDALKTLEGDLKGTYFPLTGMTPTKQTHLIEDHFLFKDDDRFLRDANGYADWPSGRGIYHTPNKHFLVWVNEEDHLRLISMQKGGNLKEVYLRLITAIEKMEQKLKFAKLPKLGYLTFCPSNLGTTLRASVHIKIPLLAAQPNFKEVCEKLQVQARGIHGEHTESAGGVYDISNKRRLGLTEYEAIMEMANGVKKILAKEKELEQKKGN